ncbi:MAG: glycosyltransferase [Gemmatimonadota bacterium]|nr:MAG: glycosyltransferase [Gemmatimonadota bacterium]
MRILHLSKFYPPDPGGLEHVVASLAEGAAARGHEVRVVCATGSRWAGERRDADVEGGVEVVRLPTRGIWWSQPMAPGYLAAARWPADVVYLHRPHPLADLAVLLGPRRRTVVFHHADVQRQRAARLVYGPLAHAVARRAAATVVATSAHLGHARDLGSAGRAKAVVIPYGTDETRFIPDPDAPRPAAFPLREAGPLALFVGRLVPYKGLDVLVRAAAAAGLGVVIVGDGPVRGELAELISRLGVGKRVVLAGRVPASELPEYYQVADYFVLPSVSPAEMFGVSMLEAMACGKPVISTGLGTGVGEVNQPGTTGLEVPPGDEQALKDAMERLARDSALRERLGVAARRRAAEEFSLAGMVERHLELCEALVRGEAG